MKTTFRTMIALAVAATAMISCGKQQNVKEPAPDGYKKITLSAGFNACEGTKLAMGGMTAAGKQTIRWEDTDAVHFATWADGQTEIHDHGAFEVADIEEYLSDDGETYTKALFTGYVKDAALNDVKGAAIFPYQEGTTIDKGINPKMYVKIPTEQDGTGIKYLVATAKTKPDLFDDAAVIGAFNVSASMIKINIPSSYLSSKITSVKLEIDPKGSLASSAFIAGDNCFVQPTSNIAVMGGNSKSVTVAKEEGFITGDVYFTIRPLTNASFFPIDMKFVFTNKDGKTRTLVSTVDTPNTIGNGKIFDFGTVTKLDFTKEEEPEEPQDDDDIKVDLTLDLNFTANKNAVLYTLSGDEKVYLPTANTTTAADLLFDQDGKTYTFSVSAGGYYYFGKTGQTNAAAYGLFLNQGKTYLKLPVIEGYKVATIQGTHGKGSTNDGQVILASSTSQTDGKQIEGGVYATFPAAGLGSLGSIYDVRSLTEPVYLYGRNVANPTSAQMSTNTTVIGRLLVGYTKL